jgi:hypothetical protein
MANAKITALPVAITPLAGTEVLPIVQSGVTDQVSVANLTAGRAVATGNLTVTGTATVSSTADVAGNFSVATNKFNVTAASGNTTTAGTLGVTGLTTVTGGLAGGVQSLSGPGAVNLTTLTTAFTSTGAGDALTLANGTVGQIKTIVYVDEAAGADTGVLTPTSRIGYASITLYAIGDSVTLQYLSTGWAVLAVNGSTITP